LARTSAAPGKTRLANFYRVQRGSAPAFYLVDLPGYGYARGGDAAAREFKGLTEAYFNRDTRAGVILLIDSRHPGLESDVEAWEWLRSQPFPSGIVGTKVDKLTRAERNRNARALESTFDEPVLLVSTKDGEGLEELWKKIANLPRTAA
jgi:GTP-binding protein